MWFLHCRLNFHQNERGMKAFYSLNNNSLFQCQIKMLGKMVLMSLLLSASCYGCTDNECVISEIFNLKTVRCSDPWLNKIRFILAKFDIVFDLAHPIPPNTVSVKHNRIMTITCIYVLLFLCSCWK